MANNIVSTDIQQLINGWVAREQEGELFPVPFDLAWQIAGYARKDHGKRRLTAKSSHLKEGIDYLLTSGECSPSGRFSDSIVMSCDTFKHFCLIAETEEGDAIRQYFIEVEKKWRLVEQFKPEIAQEIEALKIKAEIARNEAIAAKANEAALQLRHYVVTTLPEPLQQKILGYQVVEKTEYRDRIIHNDDVIRDGTTINKTQLCRRYGFVTRTGTPDYRKLNRYLGQIGLPSGAWKLTATIRENEELNIEYLEELDERLLGSDRQLFLGE